jgi:gliding motility-associated-like protein
MYAQSPYAISPKWFFGRRAGMDFSGGAPVVMLGGKVDGSGQEQSSTMCDTTGNVLFYSDSYNLYDGTNTFKQTLNGGTSSTNSSVCFPDPANPAKQFYYVTANQDLGGGGTFSATPGIYYYHIQRTGPGTINVLSGPTLLALNSQVTEQLCAGTDTNGGYWVVAHQGGGGGGNGNQIWSWNFTPSGVGAKQISSIAGTDAATSFQGSLKINKCQNRLAAVMYSGKVEVYDWDNAAGKVTSLYRSYSIPGAFGYGCEFSPDGNMLYFTSLVANQLYQFDLASNTVITLGGSSNNINEMGTIQLGPDDKVYVTNVANYAQPCYIGVVSNPNTAGVGCSYSSTGFILNNSVGNWPNIFRGIANEAWINPILNIDTTGACKQLVFSYNISTYFGKNVSIQVGSEEWDFGDGSGFQAGLGATPSHTYASGGSYTITMRVKDGICGNKFRVSKTLTVNNCSVPPPTCTTGITATISPVSNVALDFINPVTVNFDGSPSTFDGANPATHRYYWSLGTPDTTTTLSTTNSTSLTFQYNGGGGNHPQGGYDIYLIIKQGLYCIDTATVHLNVTHFYIPNLVTPNGDFKNDKFEISNTAGRFDVEVYNRWGERIFKEKGYTDGWDLGNVSDGVYYFNIVDAESAQNYKGWVQVMHIIER